MNGVAAVERRGGGSRRARGRAGICARRLTRPMLLRLWDSCCAHGVTGLGVTDLGVTGLGVTDALEGGGPGSISEMATAAALKRAAAGGNLTGEQRAAASAPQAFG